MVFFSQNYFREDFLHGPLHFVHHDWPCHHFYYYRASKVRMNVKRSLKTFGGYQKWSNRTSFWNINILASSNKTKFCNILENSLFALRQFKAQTYCKMTKPPSSSSQGGLSFSQRLSFLSSDSKTRKVEVVELSKEISKFCTTWSYFIQGVEFSLLRQQYTESWNQILEIFWSMILDLRS